MVRLRSALVFLALAFACRALPSAVPLADTGEGRAFDEGALGRNRVALERKSGGDDSDSFDMDSDETITVVAAVDAGDAGDAGAPEAGIASSDAGDTGTRWAGEYFGKDRHEERISGRPEKVELDDKAHTRVEEPVPGVALITLVSSASGEPICSMRHRMTGDRAELESGQSCAPLSLMPPLTLTGSAKLAGDSLVLDLEGHGRFPAGDETIDLDVQYHFEGKRR
jgi:hypothetical protein